MTNSTVLVSFETENLEKIFKTLNIIDEAIKSGPNSWGLGGSIGLSVLGLLNRQLTNSDVDIVCYNDSAYKRVCSLAVVDKTDEYKGLSEFGRDQFRGYINNCRLCVFLRASDIEFEKTQIIRACYKMFQDSEFLIDYPIYAIQAKQTYVNNFIRRVTNVRQVNTLSLAAFEKHASDIQVFAKKLHELNFSTL